jgi:hypothetical protein
MGQGQPKLNNLLGQNDGFLKLLESAVPAENVIDANGAGLSTELLFAIHNRVPIDYMGDIADYKFICGPRLYNRWAQSLVGRETSLGDAAVLSGGLYRPLGEQVFHVPLWPENLDLGGGETDGTTVRVQGFTKHPVVHACIRTIVDIIASVPLKAYRDRSDTTSEVPDAHPLSQLLATPS